MLRYHADLSDRPESDLLTQSRDPIAVSGIQESRDSRAVGNLAYSDAESSQLHDKRLYLVELGNSKELLE